MDDLENHMVLPYADDDQPEPYEDHDPEGEELRQHELDDIKGLAADLMGCYEPGFMLKKQAE